ncbi:collagen alpha-6(VI) chain-like isoform 1-T2 [Lycodopsis pacificus]
MKGRTSLLFLIIAACSSGSAALTTECENATLADIVFLVDGSSSIGSVNFQEARSFVRSLIKALDIGPDKVRIGLAQYSNKTFPEFLLKDHTNKKSLLAAVEKFPYRKGGTKTGEAIEYLLKNYFTEDAGSRANQRVPQIVVVITDGDSRDNVTASAQLLRQHGVIVFGIGVGAANREKMESIANWPPKRFLSSIDNYQDLKTLKDHLLQMVCVTVEDQRQALADRFGDTFFLVDSGIPPEQFSIFKKDFLKLIDELNVGASSYRIGLAQYGQEPKTEFYLNTFQTKQETLAAVKRFRLAPKPNQSRNLGRALKYARTHFFTRGAGGRAHQGTPQSLVVVSGRKSDDYVSEHAQNIKKAAVTVYGMSAGASRDELMLFASDRYAFDSPRLLLLKKFLMTEQKETITEDCKGANVADIVFIVDESGSIGNDNFQLVRTFLHSVVSGLDVSPSRVRVGIVTYNDMSTAQVYLDTFNDKAEVLQFIKILPYGEGGTNTGAALNFTLKEIFIKEKGSRRAEGVQQVAVVITDGQSQDNVSNAALNLRRAGVTIYTVGIENANKPQLEEMATHPPDKYVFNVASFTELKPLKLSLQKVLCENIIDQVTSVGTRETSNRGACVQKDEADIFFLMDDSGSIENLDFEDMKTFIIKFLHTFTIGPENVRVGLVKYADSPNMEFDMTAYPDAKSLEKVVLDIKHVGGGTETGKALLSMGKHFERAVASRVHKVPEYLIVITDGKSTDEVKAPAEQLRAQGVIVYAIGVKDSNKTELEEIAGDPKRTIYVNNFDALKSINNNIITDICSEDACRDVEGDIFFLTDSSETISNKDFQTMKEFMKSVIGKSAIGQTEVQVGVMQFSSNHNLELPLRHYSSPDDIMSAIDNMEQMNEGTLTGKALKEVSQYFDATRGRQRGKRQSLIVITDGEAKDQVKGPAEDLRAKGVVVYAIGIADANRTQLEEISGSPDRVYVKRNFNALKDLERQMTLKMCKKDCQIRKADIIFLVDSSTSIDPPEYDSMRTFMESVVNQTTVGEDQTRFGLITFSNYTVPHFTLNTFYSRRKVLSAIPVKNPQHGNTYTGEALKYSLEFFSAQHGGRTDRKVPQILMVITDGICNGDLDLKETSDALRKSGVIVVSIGVKALEDELEQMERELKTMAGGDESKVFYVDAYEGLETLYRNMSDIFCIKSACEKADLVFLLDQSGSINKSEYNIIKNFTTDLVNSFDVSEDFVHVGLAQFSDVPKHEFDLNKYFHKEDCISHIQGLEHKGGNTYIGKALDHIKDYFEVSRGSRRESPKILVLISDGDSHDEVRAAASSLKDVGIKVFAIAVGDVHPLNLHQITYTPERLFRVQNFNELANIKQKVVDEICPNDVLPQACSIDIAMGFDISREDRAPGEMLISGHAKLQAFLPEIVRYVSSVQGLCCIVKDPVKTNIAFQVLDRDGQRLYNTNFKPYSSDVVNEVMSLQMSGPSYFKTALLESFKEMFKVHSKANVKVLVIFSDGLDEDVMNLEQESELLRQSGVSALLTVALEGARDPAQLQMVEFGRGFSYKLPLSVGMQSVGNAVLKQIDSVSDRECCNVMCKCSGHEGVRGSPGGLGSKGPSGQKGQLGFPGEEGVFGERGLPGPSGPQGLEGCPGARGHKGSRGFSGKRGEDGADGLDGVNGAQGLTGTGGAQGERGEPGDPGIPGIRGEAGLRGQRGLRGDPGEPGADNTSPGAKGDPGNPGLPGLSGLDGGAGGDGGLGNPGPDGRRGSLGQKGLPGDPGDPGLQGSPGASGPQGSRGTNGGRGPKGLSGLPGPQGGPGPAGDPGLAGRRGANGQKGQPGEPGVKGAPGSRGPRGMAGQDGKDGYGPRGPEGAKGDPGFPGYLGLQGENGLEGLKGYPGPKGNQGRGGNSGGPGASGRPGELGHPGHKGPRGPPGSKGMTDCQLISYIRDNCACYHGQSECPAYPTELVLGLDMSEDVTPAAFERQRSVLLSLLEDVTVSESNCPTGARVAVVGYSADTKYLIRFQDYRRKTELIESVKNIALERTSNRRQLGAAMRFVGQNVFKRVRAGVMMRKVAVFLSNGPSQDVNDIITAVMEYRALGIVPAVISLKNAPAVGRALQVDDSGRSIFTVLGKNMAADLKKVQSCAVCYDPCQRSEQCAFIQEPVQPQEVDMDLVMVVDSSREVQADEYAGVQQLLGSVVEQLVVSPQPRLAGNQARVAVVQQSGTRDTKVGFGLGTYQTSALMRNHLIRNMTQQGGSSALGRALEFTLKEVLLKAGQPRRTKVLLTVVGTQTAHEDRAKLRYISQKAKCEGAALFVVTVGDRYDQTQVEELASPPVQQHLIHMGSLKAEEQGYAQRFFRVFLSALNKGMNTYPPPSLKKTCNQLRDKEFSPQDDEAETRGPTQSGQMDIMDTLSGGDGQSVLSGAELNDVCLLRQDVGGCYNFTVMWFFDRDEGRCSRFHYGGCGGNENRFETSKDCERLCPTRRGGGRGRRGGNSGGLRRLQRATLH